MQCNGKMGNRAGAVRDMVHLGRVLYLCVTLNFLYEVHCSCGSLRLNVLMKVCRLYVKPKMLVRREKSKRKLAIISYLMPPLKAVVYRTCPCLWAHSNNNKII